MFENLTINELHELANEKFMYWEKFGGEYWKNQYLELSDEINKREMELDKHTIYVRYEKGYKWSVWMDDEESVVTNVNKKDAMEVAKQLKQKFPYAVIDEQKLNKMEKKENLQYLHEEGITYNFK